MEMAPGSGGVATHDATVTTATGTVGVPGQVLDDVRRGEFERRSRHFAASVHQSPPI